MRQVGDFGPSFERHEAPKRFLERRSDRETSVIRPNDRSTIAHAAQHLVRERLGAARHERHDRRLATDRQQQADNDRWDRSPERAEDIHVDRLRAIGGGAKSSLWLQTKADVLDRPVEVPVVTEATCLGAALLAAVASGEYTSLTEAVQHAVIIREVYRPDEIRRRQYEAVYQVYRRLYPALKTFVPADHS